MLARRGTAGCERGRACLVEQSNLHEADDRGEDEAGALASCRNEELHRVASGLVFVQLVNTKEHAPHART